MTITMPPDYYVIEVSNEELIRSNLIKAYLRITGEADNQLLSLFVKSAIEYAEGFTGLSIVQRRIEAHFYTIHSNQFNLPRIPVTFIEKVSIINGFGKEVELKKGDYNFNSRRLTIEKDNIHAYQVNIFYRAGYTSYDIPSMLVEAILAHIGVMYENRTGEIKAPIRSLNVYLLFKGGKI